MQGSLFEEAGPPGVPVLDGTAARITLPPTSWVDLRRHWVTGQAQLLEALIDAVPWRADRRTMYDRVVDVPRLVAQFGEGDPLPHPVVAEAWARVDHRYAALGAGPVRSVGLCLYRDGADSVAWHADANGRSLPGPSLVAIVSLGWPRRLLLRPRDRSRASLRFELGQGDLLVMGGGCQREWEHAVPKTTRPVGPRLSIQFRSGTPGGDGRSPEGAPI